MLLSHRLILFSLAVVAVPSFAAETVSFTRDIRPILSDNCFACHGPDEEKREADLRLDVAQSALESGAIKPGSVDESELWTRINSSDPDEAMPPAEFHKPLTDQQRDLIARWIKSGAEYQQHWSFVAPIRPPLPDDMRPDDTLPDGEVSNPIDAFLQHRIKAAGLSPAPLADRRTLIRRVTLDLTGLPPTPEEVEAFLADESDGAYEKVIDSLMTRVTYGEHMARYWLDLARYADTHGLHLDNERSMWPYRDWVVRAFQDNLPFDEFTRWQLAGDLMENPTRDQLIASGFNRCNVSTSEGGSINEEWIYRYAVDRTTTAAEVWMGLTAGCAVCHDHKFDPLSTRDYYSMYAFFHSAADPAMDGNKIDTPPILKLYSDADEQKIKELDRQIAAIDSEIKSRLDSLDYVDPATLDPLPAVQESETLWFEDGFPVGAKLENSGAPLTLVNQSEGEVFSGERALRRKAGGLEQDFYNQGAADFVVPSGGKVFVHCFLDPEDPPETIMIQFHTDGWKHRAVWGAEAKIPFGKPDTSEKVLMGELPAPGKWVRLQVDAKRMGLQPGAKIKGFAFTQFAGTVTWDHLGIRSTVNTAKDPTWSWQVWKQQNAGKRNNDLPEGLRQLVRGKQSEQWDEKESKRVYDFWLRNFYAGTSEMIAELKAKQAELENAKATVEKDTPFTFVMADLPQPRESFVMVRGAYDKPGEKVTRAVPSFLPPLPERPQDRDYNRLDFANWLVSGEHPLTARVMVNRFWQQLFGTGIVKTSGDFGSQGDPPSHPELLDWLAVEFVENHWDVQRLVKLIVTSHAYRQSSAVTAEMLEIDPDNRLLARAPRLRLDAEVLRDQALYVSGLLVEKVGGEAVKPYQPPNIWEPVGFGNSNTRYYKQDTGDALYRRSIYTFLKRTAPPPFMSTFDAPNREQSCSRRQRSNTPMQALQLMNDIQHVEAARHFASRIISEGGDTPESRIRWAWTVVTSRPPNDAELKIAGEALATHQSHYQADPEAAKQLISYGESAVDDQRDASELASYTMLANLILNLDESVTKN